jgi:hypothetical protein
MVHQLDDRAVVENCGRGRDSALFSLFGFILVHARSLECSFNRRQTGILAETKNAPACGQVRDADMLLLMAENDESNIPSFIRRVMPDASDAELREATATLDEYMAVVWEIFQRIKREKAEIDSHKSGVCDRVDNIQPSV